MNKKLTSILIMILLIFFAVEILTSSSSIIESVNFSFNVWKNNIFPSLFPFFVLSDILVNYGFVEFTGELFKPIMNKLFKMKGDTSFAFIMSTISGFPSGAKYVNELYKQGTINEYEGTKLLTFTHFSNPLFILGTISILFLNNKEAGLLMLICHYLGNIIVGLLFSEYHKFNECNNKVSLKKAINNMTKRRIYNNKNFGQILTNAILNSINTLLLVLGVTTVFLVITTVIDNNINLNSYYQSILNGFFEMTQGLKYVSLLNIPLKLKAVISTMIISFGGFSVHMQIISILSDTKIKYLPFLTARIIHALTSSFLVYILFDWWLSL